jgi:hypothetical protein
MHKQKRLTPRQASLITGFSLFLLVLSALTLVPPAHANALTPELEIDHSISITRGGVLIVNDTIRVQNMDAEPISRLPIGFHRDFAKHLDDVYASSALGEPLTVRQDDVDDAADIFWMSVELPEAIEPNEVFTFSVAFAFSKLLNYTTSDPTLYTAIFPKYPAFPFDAASCRVDIRLPTATTLNMSSWGNATTYLKQPLEGNANQTASVSFNGTLQYLECTVLGREVVIESWGAIRAYDTYAIRNIGKETVQSIECPLPDNASEVTAYDEFGPLKTTETEVDGRRYGVVGCRYPLRGEENALPVHDAYSFTLQYRLTPGAHATGLPSITSHRIDVEGFPCPDWTVDDFHLQMTFPEGAAYTHAAPPPAAMAQSLYTQSITYTASNVTCLQPYPLTVSYDYSPFWSAFRPTLWIGLATMAVGGVAVLRKGKAPPPPTLPSTDMEGSQSYIEAGTERIGLWRELEDLENDLANRRIRRKGYNRRRRTLLQRLSVLTNEAATYKNQVNRRGDEYAELTQRLEDAEKEVRTTHAEIDRLKTQLQRGRLPQNEYRMLREACDERLRKARTGMEGVILELRQLVD